MDNKLLKVLDYLINEQEDKARDLLHQVFIEKARAIHEELMSEDDLMDEEMGGDQGEDLAHDIEHHKNEIESEEHYGDGTMEDMDLEDALSDLDDAEEDTVDMEDHGYEDMEHGDDHDMDSDMDADMDSGDVADHGGEDADSDYDEEAHIRDLEQAIEELKAEFEELKGEQDSGDEEGEEEGEGEAGEEGEAEQEGEMEESWMEDDDELDEEFDDLAESLELDTVSVNATKAAEVGSGKFARVADKSASPVATKTPAEFMGAKPTQVKGKFASGYDRQAEPSSAALPHTQGNRRKKATDGMSTVSKEGNARAMINKDRSEGFGAINVKSPIGSAKTTPEK
jgi:hypothetical protein